jgi:putative SOS response-associated peptidase YedK
MCGRFDRHRPVADFAVVVDGLVAGGSESLAPSYNIAPSQPAVVVCASDIGPRAQVLQWGLAPAWAKKSNIPRPVNARAETLSQKPMFREAFRSGRCLVLCDGYYEWQVLSDGTKQPFHLSLVDGGPFVLAGLWAYNTLLSEKPLASFCVITTAANETCRAIHPRMPVILDGDHHRQWLETSPLTLDTAGAMLRACEKPMRLTPVSRFVNNPANNGPQCATPVA